MWIGTALIGNAYLYGVIAFIWTLLGLELVT